jgi:hypothetical protein
MIEKLKRTGAYIFLMVGFYICTCLTLLLLNFIQIGSFDNIFIDGFKVAFIAGTILFIMNFLKKRKK